MDHFIPFCKSIGLEIEAQEIELLALIASLESKKKMGNCLYDNVDREEG